MPLELGRLDLVPDEGQTQRVCRRPRGRIANNLDRARSVMRLRKIAGTFGSRGYRDLPQRIRDDVVVPLLRHEAEQLVLVLVKHARDVDRAAQCPSGVEVTIDGCLNAT